MKALGARFARSASSGRRFAGWASDVLLARDPIGRERCAELAGAHRLDSRGWIALAETPG